MKRNIDDLSSNAIVALAQLALARMKHERSRKNRASYLREMASGIRSVERLRTLIKFPEDPKNEGGA